MPEPQQPNPMTAAASLWDQLLVYQPATAAALLRQLRAMPDDWPLRVFGVGRADAALNLPPAAHGEMFDDRPPEIPPYAEHNFDDCPACAETENNCRYHEGYATAYGETLQAALDAVKANPEISLRDHLRETADKDETTGT
jgi:hypothetical protein